MINSTTQIASQTTAKSSSSSPLKTQQLEVFIAICETGSLTAGAEKLGLPKANASRILKQLEYDLQTRLINRSPHHFELTEAGHEFLVGAKAICKHLNQLTTKITNRKEKVSGRLRICAPSGLALLLQGSALKTFSDKHPDLQLEFITGAPKPRVIEDNFDIVLNINTPKDSALIARRVTEVKLNYFASPSYLKERSLPTSPKELINHQCIVNLNQDREQLPWQYKENGELVKLNIVPTHLSDNGGLIREMLLNGCGVGLLPEFMCLQDVHQNKLITLFNNEYGYHVPIYAIYPSRDLMPSKTKAFLDFLQENYELNL